jgi:uncharacterized protein (DUF1330 family)
LQLVLLLGTGKVAAPPAGGGIAGRGGALAAYVIYQAEVLDAERYEAYKVLAAASIAAAGGRYLVRGGAVEALEGALPAGRSVVVEFPSMRDALAWYRGEAYTEARKLREGAAQAKMYIVEGI